MSPGRVNDIAKVQIRCLNGVLSSQFTLPLGRTIAARVELSLDEMLNHVIVYSDLWLHICRFSRTRT